MCDTVIEIAQGAANVCFEMCFQSNIGRFISHLYIYRIHINAIPIINNVQNVTSYIKHTQYHF